MSVIESFQFDITVKSCLSDTVKAYITLTGQLRLSRGLI